MSKFKLFSDNVIIARPHYPALTAHVIRNHLSGVPAKQLRFMIDGVDGMMELLWGQDIVQDHGVIDIREVNTTTTDFRPDMLLKLIDLHRSYVVPRFRAPMDVDERYEPYQFVDYVENDIKVVEIQLREAL